MKKLFVKFIAAALFLVALCLLANENPATWWSILIGLPLLGLAGALMSWIDKKERSSK